MKIKYLIGLSIVLSLAACKKNSSPGAPSATLTSMSPSKGPYGTVVTINGSGFNADMSKDSVWFNQAPAVIQAATATQLTVVVPKGAGTGTVTILVEGDELTKGPVFNFVYTADVYTISGSGTGGLVNAPDTLARYDAPTGVAVDSLGNLYVTDFANNSIRGVTSAVNTSSPNTAFQVAGVSSAGYVDGTGSQVHFFGPLALALDQSDDIYVADASNNKLRLVVFDGSVETYFLLDSATGATINLQYPDGVALDPTDTLVYVSDYGSRRIYKINQHAYRATVLAGSGTAGSADGVGVNAQFNVPAGLATDAHGNIYVADEFNNTIRKITPSGVVTTIAGTPGAPSYADGQGGAAAFYYPCSVAVDGAGNIYVADTYNNIIRMITPGGLVSTIAGSPGKAGYADGPGSKAQFSTPHGIAVDRKGNIYVADTGNNRIRKIVME